MTVNRYSDELLEKVARLICERRNLDPETRMSGDDTLGMTVAEREAYFIKTNGVLHAVGRYAPRWKFYRPQAEQMLMERELANKLDALLQEYSTAEPG
mgnify:CR=1 FL=1